MSNRWLGDHLVAFLLISGWGGVMATLLMETGTPKSEVGDFIIITFGLAFILLVGPGLERVWEWGLNNE